MILKEYISFNYNSKETIKFYFVGQVSRILCVCQSLNEDMGLTPDKALLNMHGH